MTAQVIHIREFPKTERERKIEASYLDMIARLTAAHDAEVRRLKRRTKRSRR